jgi:hypothetical protein
MKVDSPSQWDYACLMPYSIFKDMCEDTWDPILGKIECMAMEWEKLF